MEYKYKADLPYPKVAKNAPSEYEVRLIMPAYAGTVSETTAIMTYMYQDYVSGEKYPDIAKALEKIAITEMTHHEMLGELIDSLGGTPYLGSNRGFWQGSFINYTRNIKEQIDDDITNEQEAIKYYNEIADKTRNDNVRAIAERIILDEEVHIQTLTEIGFKLNGEK